MVFHAVKMVSGYRAARLIVAGCGTRVRMMVFRSVDAEALKVKFAADWRRLLVKRFTSKIRGGKSEMLMRR